MKIKKFKLFALALFFLWLTGLQAQTVKDIDGNVYNTVTIGTQVWMDENLKVTKYTDGVAIPLVTDNRTWSKPGYCWYENDEATYKNTYGALYNWHAVNTGKLCPTGWHVPSDAEWTTLTDFLGGKDVAGGKLKSITGWKSPNIVATNESGFTALPGGYRYFLYSSFKSIGNEGYWWSSTEHATFKAFYRKARNYYNDLGSYYENEANGFSVRCIMDK
ncbi:MAG: fibrobacter succinogenes major paralogous domain-containing protein [Bacteroidia bacterium]|nr:fibrobacter succinogenes major paralogous domain-containing protein [Bacteroidia bacterium]